MVNLTSLESSIKDGMRPRRFGRCSKVWDWREESLLISGGMLPFTLSVPETSSLVTRPEVHWTPFQPEQQSVLSASQEER